MMILRLLFSMFQNTIYKGYPYNLSPGSQQFTRLIGINSNQAIIRRVHTVFIDMSNFLEL